MVVELNPSIWARRVESRRGGKRLRFSLSDNGVMICERRSLDDGSSSEMAYPSEDIFSEVRECIWFWGGDTEPLEEYERRDRDEAMELLLGIVPYMPIVVAGGRGGGVMAVGLGASSELRPDA